MYTVRIETYAHSQDFERETLEAATKLAHKLASKYDYLSPDITVYDSSDIVVLEIAGE